MLYEFESDSTFVSVTDTNSTVLNHQEIDYGGFTAVTDTEVYEEYRILDNPQGHLELGRVETHIVNTILGITTEEDVVSTFTPWKYVGPAKRACQGVPWTEPSVVEEITSSNSGTFTENTIVVNGVVESVNDVQTVGAGTFSTVRLRRTEASGGSIGWYTITRIDPATGIMVLMEAYDDTDTLRGWAELKAIN